MTNNYSEEPVEVPSPFGVFKDGVKIETTGEPLKTMFPGWVDPITGYTVELNTYEQLGMQADGDDYLLEILDALTADQQAYFIDAVMRVTGSFINEVQMNAEDR